MLGRGVNTISLFHQPFLQESCTFVLLFFFSFRVQTLANVVHATGREDSTSRRTHRTRGTDAHFSRAHVTNAHALAQDLTGKDMWIVCLRALIKITHSFHVSWYTTCVTALFAQSVLIILFYTTSCTDISAKHGNESKPLRHSARMSPLWPIGRAEPSHRCSTPC